MPTFTGVCSWKELPSTLANLASSTDYFSIRIDLSGGTGGTSGQTVYTAPNGVVVTSSAPTYSGTESHYYAIGCLFDGTVTTAHSQWDTYWLTSSSGNQTLTFDFGALGSPMIGAIVVYPRARDDASSNYRILVSDDDVNYAEIVPWVVNTHDATTPYGTRRVHKVNIQKRYVRFELTQNRFWGVTLSEIEFYTGGGVSVAFSRGVMRYLGDLSIQLEVDFLPYVSDASTKDSYPVQYLIKVESGYIILAVQGIYQVDTSARTHIIYAGRLSTPPGTPPAYAAATTMGNANLMATLSDNRRASVQSTYNVYPSQVPVSPDIQNRFALVPIYVYHPDENWRGWFKDLYVAQIPPQTMLNGETVTAQDGSKYTFFNIPPSGDGYYNNFLAADATNQWLVVKH